MQTITQVVKKIETPEVIDQQNLPNYRQSSVCKPVCPICGGIGYVRVDRPVGHPRFGKLEPCPNMDPIKLYGSRVGLNDRELKLSWNSLIDYNRIGQAINEIKEAIDCGYGWLYIWGVFGLGKTTLLKTAIAESMRYGRQSSYVRMVDIIDDLRNAFSTDNPNEVSARRLEFWTEVPVLAIDEFDRIRLTEYAEERRFSLMDHRYENAIRGKSITIMASNSDPRDLDGYLADRVFDGRFRVIHLTGNSFRPNMGD